ncbi:DEKNAAC105447 [Brettanomyces naardenensis]|uniref:DEKNAAC105447 n=1 Tax=Brettanomyces naardenensis TaxID=13370 RepID=A0A448YTE3_BRENA|nr:DEKNAAC105447 [Brettanomyces naardenensis]
MTRIIRVASAQVGAIGKDTSPLVVVNRLIKMLDQAHEEGVKLVNFPELAFSTFFARFLIPYGEELDKWFLKGDVRKIEPYDKFFAKAKEYGISISIGYAELTDEGDHYNTSIFVDQDGNIVNKYRKTHLPGDKEPVPNAPHQHLEKRYFLPGNTGFKAFRWPGTGTGHGGPIVGQLICNDRRWCESWRVLGLQGTELVLIGYNTPTASKWLDGVDPGKAGIDSDKLAKHQNDICLMYNTYSNCCFSICSARCGIDDGKYGMISGSTIIDPNGIIIAKAESEGDELIWADIDLDQCYGSRDRVFNFGKHRRPEMYGLIVEQRGVEEIPELAN